MLSLLTATRVATLIFWARETSRARKVTLFLVPLVAMLACDRETARGQSALDGFDPNANGFVHVVVVQPDGKILLGGEFTTLSPNGGAAVARNHIARLNPDGTLDDAFNPNADDNVYSIAVQPDGKVLVGGTFTSIGGRLRSRMARLDPVTGLADSFDPHPESALYVYWGIKIALQADGKILAVGGFTSIGGQSRNRMARLDPITGLADALNPQPNNSVSAIAIQADGKILVGGFFTSIGGMSRGRIARLDAVTGAPDSFNPNASSAVYTIAVQADGKVLAGGDFSGANSIGGQTRNRIARLEATTGLADSFDPNANIDVQSIVVQTDGRILVGGHFSSIGGATRKGIARLDPMTAAADSFDPNSHGSGLVDSIAVQPNGSILAGGLFSIMAGQPRKNIARLETDGRIDQTLKLNTAGGSVLATAIESDGRILIGGSFTTVLSVSRNHLARLNRDGTLDLAFNPNANGNVESIAVQADGRILAGGEFTSIGGQPRNRIGRVDATTGLVDSFDPNANGIVQSIAVQADGRILAGGMFTSIGGQPRNRIGRVDATTGLADSFDPNANGIVQSIAVQADGKILAAGQFTSIGGQPRNRVARLAVATGLADSFNPNANGDVESIAVQADGRIVAGGMFTSIGGQPRNRVARLDITTGAADSFNPNANGTVESIAVQADGKILVSGGFNGPNSIGGQTRNYLARLDATTGLADSFNPNANDVVESIAVQADGKILVAGQFETIGGQARGGFARLSNDTAALQDLAVTQTTVTWARGGSSPQFTRVAFDSSTDNVNYAPLGNGTAAGTNWILTGLSLPAGQSIYVRARGYYRSGDFNGSESNSELVRNGPAVNAAPTPTAAPTSTPTASPTPRPTATPTPMPTATAASGDPPCTSTVFRENFDGVTAPALPVGWVASFNPGPANCTPIGTCPLGTNWATNSVVPDTPPNSAFHDDPNCVTDSNLDTPSILIGLFDNLSFTHSYNLENGFDGGVLEISIEGGAFTDIVAAGGFASYSGMISMGFLSPIAGRAAWTGNSGGYITTIVNLPPSATGHNVVFRFRLATDCSGAGVGWRVDTVRVWHITSCQPTPTPPPVTPPPGLCILVQGFDDIATLVPNGWVMRNNSQPGPGTIGWFRGSTGVFPSQSGAADSYISANYNNGSGTSILSNWLLTPPLVLQNGAVMTFFTRTVNEPAFPDRLQVRMSTNGASSYVGTGAAEVGDFLTLLLDINPNYTLTGYPNVWTQFTVTLSGIASPINGRLAFRYFVESGGPNGANSDYIGIDTLQFNGVCGPTPTPGTPTPTPGTPTPAPPTPTPEPPTPTPGTPTPTPETPTPTPETPTPTPSPTIEVKAINLSSRLRVQSGDNAGIGGFIITGTGLKHVLFRGIGPSLVDSGIAGVLADPTLDLRDSVGVRIRANDNWRDMQEVEIKATGIPPANNLEAALVETLAPGSYTVILSGVGMTSGVGLVEIYDLDQGSDSKLANLSTRAFVGTSNDVLIAGFVLGGESGDDGIVLRGVGPSLTAVGVPDALADPTLELRDENGALRAANNDWQDNPGQAAELTAAGLALENQFESGIAIALPPGPYTALLAGRNNGTGVGLVEVYDRGEQK